ncbi:MAG: 50S ribosomal protein L9 [Opitutaceae bacterium]|jgi:large subunit ribosomal protein L9|nr:50S ribosomal protein L9 [Opitutaceae bacterium]
MAHSEVLLIKPVGNLGAEGDQVKVRAGYARNYLIPQKLAVALTQANRKRVEALKKRRAEREAAELEGAQKLKGFIEKVSVVFVVKTGEGGKMFGAITAADIHQKLGEAGIDLDKRKIHLHTPVKTLGKHEVKIHLHQEITFQLPFEIVSENPIEEPVAEEPEAPRTEKAHPKRKSSSGKEKKPAKPAKDSPAEEKAD